MATTRIMIIAGEASGDMHGANLIKAARQLDSDISVCGVGGSALVAAGMESIYDAAKLAVLGLLEVFHHLTDIRQALKTIEARLRDDPPDLLILIDFPDFNLMVAKKAQKLNVPVFYYISPQVWAWRSGRVKTIARRVDKMAVILPFEKEFYAKRGMEVEFVGHPLLDSVKTSLTRSEFIEKNDIPADAKLVGILPGSRRKEISSMLPLFLQSAVELAQVEDNLVFLLPLAPTITLADLIDNGLKDYDIDVRVIAENRYDLMAACDCALAASGTVALELAILKVPSLVAYKVSALTYFLGNRLIKVKYASLVNLVADRAVTCELLQDDAVVDLILPELQELLKNKKKIKKMQDDFVDICKELGGAGASRRAAELALDLASSSRGQQ